ncbi:MAG: hypothetical protein SV487_03020 [Thermodesulfobacteriota bacterium]|nr:hypothetical protein [Thermodesulfobacteriota bacterium]
MKKKKASRAKAGLSGLPLYLDLLHQMDLRESIESNIGVRAESQGWTGSEMILSLIFLNLSGGQAFPAVDFKSIKGISFVPYIHRGQAKDFPVAPSAGRIGWTWNTEW